LPENIKEELQISDLAKTEHKSEYIKHIHEMTNIAVTTQNINDIMLMGEYRAI